MDPPKSWNLAQAELHISLWLCWREDIANSETTDLGQTTAVFEEGFVGVGLIQRPGQKSRVEIAHCWCGISVLQELLAGALV